MTHFPVKTLLFRPNRLCQGLFDGRGAVQVEFAGEDKNRRFAPIPLEGQCKIAWPGGPGLGRCALAGPPQLAGPTSGGAVFICSLPITIRDPSQFLRKNQARDEVSDEVMTRYWAEHGLAKSGLSK